MITKESIAKVHGWCREYLSYCNRKQTDALWEYIKMKAKDEFTWTKVTGVVGILAFWNSLEENKAGKYNEIIYDNFCSYWTFMLGMLMVQDEYNKYNPKWKSPLKK